MQQPLATSPLSASAEPFQPKHHPLLGQIRQRPPAAVVASSEYTTTPSIAIPRQQQTKPNPTPWTADDVSESEEESDYDDGDHDEEAISSSYGSNSAATPPPISHFAPSPLLNALYFPTPKSEGAGASSSCSYQCVLCSTQDADVLAVLTHMKEVHQVVVEAVEIIADLRRYLDFWRERLCASSLEAQTTPHGCYDSAKKMFTLGPRIPDDKQKRDELQQARLAALLEKQQEERNDKSFSRKCLFCKKVCTGDRTTLFTHMFNVHKFNIGLPDNLVHLNELIDLLQAKIASLQCIYCEKTFKSYSVLKLHMRKKKHFKIDARNHEYDRFYLINYLEAGKDWKQIQDEEEDEPEAKDENWADWVEDGEEASVCLFCSQTTPTADRCLQHMKETHGFDLRKLVEEWKLDDYDSIKVINYIRRSIYELRCPLCGHTHQKATELHSHLQREKHCGVQRNDPSWRDTQYLFPTYENDALLTSFADFSSDDEAAPEPLSRLDQERMLRDLGMDQILDHADQP